MKSYYFIYFIFNILALISNIIILIFAPSIVYISISNALFIIFLPFCLLYYLKFYLNVKLNVLKTEFNKELFFVLWNSIWRSGLAKMLAPIIKHISGILFAQVASPVASVSYLITQRSFNVFSSFSVVAISSRIPKIARLRANKDFINLNPLINSTTFFSYLVIVIGYTIILFFGNQILSLLSDDINFPDFHILIIFSFMYIFHRNSGILLNLSNQANKVIGTHSNSLLCFILFFILIIMYLVSYSFEIWMFPSVTFFKLNDKFIFIYPRVYRIYDSTFIKFENSFIKIIFIKYSCKLYLLFNIKLDVILLIIRNLLLIIFMIGLYAKHSTEIFNFPVPYYLCLVSGFLLILFNLKKAQSKSAIYILLFIFFSFLFFILSLNTGFFYEKFKISYN